MPNFALLAPIAVYIVLAAGATPARVRRLVIWGIPVALALAATGWYNWARFGNALQTGHSAESQFTSSLTDSLPAYIGSPLRGIFLFSPVLLLVFFGVKRFLRREWQLACTLAAVVILTMLLYGKWKDWGGGLAWGPRFLVPLTPLLLLSTAPVLASWRSLSPWARLGILALAAVSIAVQVLGVAVDMVAQWYLLERSVPAIQTWVPAHSLVWRHLVAVGQVLQGNARSAHALHPLAGDDLGLLVGLRPDRGPEQGGDHRANGAAGRTDRVELGDAAARVGCYRAGRGLRLAPIHDTANPTRSGASMSSAVAPPPVLATRGRWQGGHGG